MENKEHWDNLIVAYLNGTINDEDKLALDGWVSYDSGNQSYFHEIEQLWYLLDITRGCEQFDSERAFSLFQERIRQTSIQGRKDRHTLSLNYAIHWKSFAKYAAVAVFCLFIGYKYLTPEYKFPDYSGISQVVVPNGAKTDLVLSDGTRVSLNSGSKIEVRSGFGDKDRTVRLCGEAYFDVAHDSLCPFYVETGNDLKVKVLGTRFNVNAYATNDEIHVNLFDGVVEMTTPQADTIRLKPQQVASYNLMSKTLTLKQQPDNSSTGWMEDKLIFNNETFEQIAYKLEREFDVKINLYNTSIRYQRFSGDFINGESIGQIFKIISNDNKCRYEETDAGINIY